MDKVSGYLRIVWVRIGVHEDGVHKVLGYARMVLIKSCIT